MVVVLADLQGYLVLPGILSSEQVAPILQHQLQFRTDPASLPVHERDYHGGPSVSLLDHPVVVGVLNEILSYQTLASGIGKAADITRRKRQVPQDSTITRLIASGNG